MRVAGNQLEKRVAKIESTHGLSDKDSRTQWINQYLDYLESLSLSEREMCRQEVLSHPEAALMAPEDRISYTATVNMLFDKINEFEARYQK